MKKFCEKHKSTIWNVIALQVAIAVVIVIVILSQYEFSSSKYNNHYRGAIVTDHSNCALIGRSLIDEGAGAVDAVIACQICDGAMNAQHLRKGGGFVMNFYKRKTKEAVVVNYIELNSKDGSKSIGPRSRTFVPKAFKGLWDAHRRYGKLPWSTLVEPTIQLCKSGHFVSKNLERAFKENEDLIQNTPQLRKSYIDPSTNQTFSYRSRIQQAKLVQYLQVLSRPGFFNNTRRKFRIYKPNHVAPLSVKIFKGYTLHTVDKPGSGAILLFILKVLDGLLEDTNYYRATYWHRLAEVFKYAYGKSAGLDSREKTDKLVSDDFAEDIRLRLRDDYTSSDPKYYGIRELIAEDNDFHSVVVYAPNGDAAVISYSLSKKFVKDGSKADTPSPEDVSKRLPPPQLPISFMCPTIIVNTKGNVVLVIGGSGNGFTYLISVAQVILRRLWFRQKLYDAIHDPRMYQEFFPLQLKFENDFNKRIIEELVKIGHKVDSSPAKGSSIDAVGKESQVAEYYYDRRSEGGEVMLN